MNNLSHADKLTMLLSKTITTPEGCMEWQLYKDKDGYGKVKFEGTQRGAHRIALFYSTGVMGAVAMHKCDNPSCINPQHLKWGTIAENNADMKAKGRNGLGEKMARKGTNSGMAKLNDAQVLEIRSLVEKGTISQRAIAKLYGMSHTMIQDIVSRKHWTHI